MARQGIFTGFTPNDGLEILALGASKVNANFSEIYTTFGDGTNLSANAGSAGTWTKQRTQEYTQVRTQVSEQLYLPAYICIW